MQPHSQEINDLYDQVARIRLSAYRPEPVHIYSVASRERVGMPIEFARPASTTLDNQSQPE